MADANPIEACLMSADLVDADLSGANFAVVIATLNSLKL
ncbi:pentapeptide repeat-containing protein [Chroococcidiopsis sp. FACHB-1243]|nr:pentapeptide repeat-containing protein [Chroococcidiopsis sp. [FACHB-1243]]